MNLQVAPTSTGGDLSLGGYIPVNNQPIVKITHTLVITNDTNDIWFKEVGWELPINVGNNINIYIFNPRRVDKLEVRYFLGME